MTGDLRPLLLGMGWPSGQPGGLNRYFADLLAALEGSGAGPTAIVVGPAPGAPSSVVVAAEAREALPRRLWRYARAVRRPAEVVDAHFSLYAFLPALLLRSRPLVVHFHGPWAGESRAAGQYGFVALAVKRRVERAVYRRADCLVTLSAAFKRLLVERYGVNPWRVFVIPPGINLERFHAGGREAARDALALDGDAFVAVTVRRLVPRMGIDVLLRAWAALSDNRRVLFVLGEGPERHRLETLAATLGILDSVRFLGRVSDDELVAYYQAADVSVVPSIALEGFGLVVLESLACGTPVIVSDVGGLPETVTRLDPSLIVSAGDADALGRRVEAAIDGSNPLPARERCRRFAESFTWERVATQHQEIYRAAISHDEPKTKVVYVDHCARLSGGELALLRLLPALDVRVHVILGEDGPLVSKLIQAGVSVEVLPMPETARRLARDRIDGGSLPLSALAESVLYALRLARRLRQVRPDLVHTNSLKSALYGGLAGRLVRVPVVWHIRDRIAQDYMPISAVKLVRGLSRRLPAAVIANSRATLSTLEPFGMPHAVIASPIDLKAMSSLPRHPDPATLSIGMIGRLAPWKGQHVFLEAFARAFANGQARAVIVGAPLFGEDEYGRRLQRQAKELGLDGRVEFRGFREDVASELAELDVLVHASVTPEPFGQVIVEGMAAGLPVVAANAGGPAEVIEDGSSGLLYPAGDASALAEALARLAADPTLRRRLGEAGRQRASDFSPEAAAEATIAIYNRVLRRARHRA